MDFSPRKLLIIKRKSTGFLSFLILLLGFFSCGAQEFELTGIIEPVNFIMFTGSNAPPRTNIIISNIVSGNGVVRFPREFRVAVKGDRWLVASTNLDGRVVTYSICEPGFGVANVTVNVDVVRNKKHFSAHQEPEGIRTSLLNDAIISGIADALSVH